MTRRFSPANRAAGTASAVERPSDSSSLDESAAFDRAVRLLTSKARSSHEIRTTLVKEGADEDVAAAVVSRLVSHRQLDDAELASDQAFSLLQGKGYSPAAIREALTQRGIDGTLVDEAIAFAVEGRSEVELCAEALDRKLGSSVLTPDSAARYARALARLGWDEEVIRRVIERALPGVDDLFAPKRRRGSRQAGGAGVDSFDEDGGW